HLLSTAMFQNGCPTAKGILRMHSISMPPRTGGAHERQQRARSPRSRKPRKLQSSIDISITSLGGLLSRVFGNEWRQAPCSLTGMARGHARDQLVQPEENRGYAAESLRAGASPFGARSARAPRAAP